MNYSVILEDDQGNMLCVLNFACFDDFIKQVEYAVENGIRCTVMHEEDT